MSSGIELIVGGRRDKMLGPIVLVGLGGVYAEVLRDVAVALAPVTETQAAHLLSALPAAAMFEAFRQREAVNIAEASRRSLP